MGPLVRLLRRIGDVVDTAGIAARHRERSRGARAGRHPHVLGGPDAADGRAGAAAVAHLPLCRHGRPAGEQVPAAARPASGRRARARRVGGPAARLGPQEYARDVAALGDSVTFPVVVKPSGASSIATAPPWTGGSWQTCGGSAPGRRSSRRGVPGRPRQKSVLSLTTWPSSCWCSEVMCGAFATTGKFRHAPPFRGPGASCRARSTLGPRRSSSGRRRPPFARSVSPTASSTLTSRSPPTVPASWR